MSKPTFKQKTGLQARQRLLKTFDFDFTSETDDTRYKGKFTTKKLSIADLASLGVRKSQLNGGMYHDQKHPGQGVDPQTDDFNSMIAHLEIALQEYPDWWDLETVSDIDVMVAVFQEVMKHENSFLVPSGSGGGSEGDGGESLGTEQRDSERDQEGADAGGMASAVVVKKVQSALEP